MNEEQIAFLNDRINDLEQNNIPRWSIIDSLTARISRQNLSESDIRDLKLDIADIANTLPDDLKTVFLLLMSGNITDAARALNIPRTTLNDHVDKLRVILSKSDLKKYLK